MYGGGFATVPAYLADLFGTQMVGAIHGRLLTAWSTAGVLGPVLVNYINDYQLSIGVANERGLRHHPVHPCRAAGRRLHLQPAGATGEPKWFMTDAELEAERKLAHDAAAKSSVGGDAAAVRGVGSNPGFSSDCSGCSSACRWLGRVDDGHQGAGTVQIGARGIDATSAARRIACGPFRLRKGIEHVKTLLITGAAGDVGSHLRRELTGKYNLVLSDIKPIKTTAPGEKFLRGDVARTADMLRITRAVDAIVHLGGFAVEGPWEAILQANIVGCYNLFEAAHRNGVRRAVCLQQPCDRVFQARRENRPSRLPETGQPLWRFQGIRRTGRQPVRAQIRYGSILHAHRQRHAGAAG